MFNLIAMGVPLDIIIKNRNVINENNTVLILF